MEAIATTPTASVRDSALVRDSAYAVAMIDWLACACAGVDARAARAVRGSGDDLLTRVAFAATAGHVHDFDDTFSDGVAHVSATCAPAALVLAAELGATFGEALGAYAEAFEAMAACTAASHPALYAERMAPDRGVRAARRRRRGRAAARSLRRATRAGGPALAAARRRNAGRVRFGWQGDPGRSRRRPWRAGRPSRRGGGARQRAGREG